MKHLYNGPSMHLFTWKCHLITVTACLKHRRTDRSRKKDRAELLLRLNTCEVCTIFKSFKTIRKFDFFDSKPGSSCCLLHATLTKLWSVTIWIKPERQGLNCTSGIGNIIVRLTSEVGLWVPHLASREKLRIVLFATKRGLGLILFHKKIQSF